MTQQEVARGCRGVRPSLNWAYAFVTVSVIAFRCDARVDWNLRNHGVATVCSSWDRAIKEANDTGESHGPTSDYIYNHSHVIDSSFEAITLCPDERCESISFTYLHPDEECADLEHIGHLTGYFRYTDMLIDPVKMEVGYVFRRNASLTDTFEPLYNETIATAVGWALIILLRMLNTAPRTFLYVLYVCVSVYACFM